MTKSSYPETENTENTMQKMSQDCQLHAKTLNEKQQMSLMKKYLCNINALFFLASQILNKMFNFRGVR
jgi:hypothetical protein